MIIITTRGWALSGVHSSRQPCGAVSLSGITSHRTAVVVTFLHFLTLWPWLLTFWPNINWWARYRRRTISVPSLAILVSIVLILSCGQTDRQNHIQNHRGGSTLYWHDCEAFICKKALSVKIIGPFSPKALKCKKFGWPLSIIGLICKNDVGSNVLVPVHWH